MTLPDLLAAIEEDAADELGDARAEADRRSAALLAEAQASLAAHRADVTARAERAADDERASALAAARAEGAVRLRAARQEALSAVLDRVRQDLGELRHGPAAEASLAVLLDEALRALPQATHVHADPADAERLRSLLAARGRGDLELVADLRSAHGVAVSGPGRRVDNTAETRLAAAWPQLRGALAARWERELAETVHAADGERDDDSHERGSVR
jgi:V/A-type H+-transporting ATPase subunit E